MQRYKLEQIKVFDPTLRPTLKETERTIMTPDPNGEYVKYEDVPKPKKFIYLDVVEISSELWSATVNNKRIGQAFSAKNYGKAHDKMLELYNQYCFIRDMLKEEKEK